MHTVMQRTYPKWRECMAVLNVEGLWVPDNLSKECMERKRLRIILS